MLMVSCIRLLSECEIDLVIEIHSNTEERKTLSDNERVEVVNCGEVKKKD
jgi:hypothetical protein